MNIPSKDKPVLPEFPDDILEVDDFRMKRFVQNNVVLEDISEPEGLVQEKKRKRVDEFSLGVENVCLVKEGYVDVDVDEDVGVQEKESDESSDDELSRVCALCGVIPSSLTKYSEEVEAAMDEGQRVKGNQSNRRFTTYKCFVENAFGVLGKGKRIPLPTCVKSYFKDQFPEEDKTKYVGYKSKITCD